MFNQVELPASTIEVFKTLCKEKRPTLESMLSKGNDFEKLASSVILSAGEA